MSFLLDTNIVSEWVKPRPDSGVVAWLAEVDEDQVFISVITLAELRYGIDRLLPGRRLARLTEWLEIELPLRFEGRILSIDRRIANEWGRFVARSRVIGRPMGPMDAFLAATAECHRLTLVTRNVKDFQPLLADLLSPWKDS